MWFTYAILAAILWGLNYALAEKILQHISPVTLLSIEMVIGGICFFILSLFMNFKSDVTAVFTNTSLLKLVVAEILAVLLANFLIVYSIKAKDATAASIVELTYPLFTILFTWLIFRENHITTQVVLGGVLIFMGVLLISQA